MNQMVSKEINHGQSGGMARDGGSGANHTYTLANHGRNFQETSAEANLPIWPSTWAFTWAFSFLHLEIGAEYV